MIVFVDYEHADRYAKDDSEWLLAARTRITYRLEDLSGQHCMLVRYDRVTPELLDHLDATAIFISGNGTPPANYSAADIEPLADIVRNTNLPMFGFCGGFQFIAAALGSPVVQLELPADTQETEILKKGPDGGFYEFGYHPIEVAGDHPLLKGWVDAPVFRHAHGLEVPKPPVGFEVFGSTQLTRVQLAIDDNRRIVGTQFHPEYWTDEHPAGRALITNFMTWAGLIS